MADEDSRLKDKRLDFLSDKFDPLRALYTKELQPPIPNIQVFNNLAEYARIIKEGKTKTQPSVAAALKVGPSRRTRNLKPEFKPPDIGTRLKAIASEQNQGDLASKEKLDALGGGVKPPFSCGKTGTTLGLGTENRWKKKYKNVLERMEGT
ncbi:hypothetical protein QZH41_002354 [Actinostola sp. cb2023]|nr:hypothetical protein QZH41_002354 [Actinostola sp. cb2023]